MDLNEMLKQGEVKYSNNPDVRMRQLEQKYKDAEITEELEVEEEITDEDKIEELVQHSAVTWMDECDYCGSQVYRLSEDLCWCSQCQRALNHSKYLKKYDIYRWREKDDAMEQIRRLYDENR